MALDLCSKLHFAKYLLNKWMDFGRIPCEYIGRCNHKQCKIVKLLSAFGFRLRQSIKKVQLKSCVNISVGSIYKYTATN